MKKTIIALCVAATMPLAYAETVSVDLDLEEVSELNDAPDPGDHTKVSTMVGATYGVQGAGEGNNQMVEFVGQMSGAKDSGNLFLALGQVTGREGASGEDSSFELSKLRGRYFEVTQTGSELFPMAGISLDYIETGMTDGLTERLVAVGGVVRATTPADNWLAFPIVAAVYAQNDDSLSGLPKGYVDSNAWGMQVNLMNSIYLHENGTHIQINPQYTSLDMGGQLGTVNTLQLDMALQAPLSKDRKHWGKITYTEFFDDAARNSIHHNDQVREIKFTYNYFM
ncbi:hypothetical protein SIN8267_02043 [Sinobacterium norvegicum]|uniref:Porin n=1 Tax=Sinobacterium norvegicum TaxID=1641715 RepID=A0ABN8EJS8_9GAMM|nr:hypothetical protein [Sinobacterium norvegicum]CAH0991928.1 hypothetical protein SIN8267_02043 [Sinobacterium norvegicum]